MSNELNLDVPVLRLAEAGFRIENVEAGTCEEIGAQMISSV
jgi:hypothetical protein